MSIKSITIAAFSLLALLAGAAGSASAHGFHHHHFGRSFGIVIGSGGGYGGCGYYREMWEDTGRFKWKRRYYECKGWW